MITHLKKNLSTLAQWSGVVPFYHVGFHTEVAREWPYVCFV